MQYRKRSVLASVAFVAVGAIAGAWITAKTGHFPFSVENVPVAAQSAPQVSLQMGFGQVVKAVQPAVVSVLSTTNPQARVSRNDRQDPPQNLPPEFQFFFGDQGGQSPFDFNMPEQGPQSGLGSGVITTEDGYIVTNAHVVDGADKVQVFLADKREFTAKVVGKDDASDIAVLKIDAAGLPHVNFGDSEGVEVGDIVLAMGNPFGIGQTVTMGIVGATHRNTPPGMAQIEEYEDFIQTDAAINPGNSGGALVNLKGELIGINTAILSRSGGNQGVGFAIPVKTARYVTEQIREHGTVSRGHMGVGIQPVDTALAEQFGLKGNPRGALVSEVTPGSAAAKAGVQVGDIILELNNSQVADSSDLRLKVAALRPGTAAAVKVWRDGAEKALNLTLGSQPGAKEVSRNIEPLKEGDSGPRLGVSLEKADRGLRVTSVQPGSAAEQAGLTDGDVILQVNRKPAPDVAEFQKLVRAAKDQKLLLLVQSAPARGTQQAVGQHFVTVQPR